jgi:hypothetical protein
VAARGCDLQRPFDVLLPFDVIEVCLVLAVPLEQLLQIHSDPGKRALAI